MKEPALLPGSQLVTRARRHRDSEAKSLGDNGEQRGPRLEIFFGMSQARTAPLANSFTKIRLIFSTVGSDINLRLFINTTRLLKFASTTQT